MYSPKEIATNYVDVAKAKTSNKWYKTLMLAVLAGMFIALGGALATVAGAAVEGSAALVKGAVFPLGLILVVLAGSELFTGNCLLLAPTLSKDVKISATLKNLGIVYGGNVIGSALVALISVYGGTFGADGASIILTASAKCSMSFLECMLRAIPCNILVCLAVWISMASKSATGKILAVYLPIFAFVVCGFEHCVANMFYLSAGFLAAAKYGVAAENITVGNALLNNLLPATIGNVIGGMVFVALPYWLVYLKKDKSAPEEKTETATE